MSSQFRLALLFNTRILQYNAMTYIKYTVAVHVAQELGMLEQNLPIVLSGIYSTLGTYEVYFVKATCSQSFGIRSELILNDIIFAFLKESRSI